MKGQRRIVILAESAHGAAIGSRSQYKTKQGGLEGLIQGGALDFASNNILINLLRPGYIETSNPQADEELLNKIPLGRFAQPSEIASVALFLGSSLNSFITGQSIAVDGGLSAK